MSLPPKPNKLPKNIKLPERLAEVVRPKPMPENPRVIGRPGGRKKP